MRSRNSLENSGTIQAVHKEGCVLEIASTDRVWVYMPLAECPAKHVRAVEDKFREARWKVGDKVTYEILDDVYNPLVHKIRKV